MLAKEIFTQPIDEAARRGRIGYHPKCKGLNLTHLIFADELLVFSNGSLASLTAMQTVLHNFYLITGLKLNVEKLEIFISGMLESQAQILLAGTSFKKGQLPVRYLGVPLTSGKLSSKDCQALTKRITKRLSSWSTQSLSYSGRLQLINSVIHNMMNYWCMHFILPMKVINQVKQSCARILWHGSPNAKGAKIKWTDLCVPKKEGGLGIKDIAIWNKACMLKNLWSELIQAGSLWVAWVHKYLIKGKNVWTLKIMQNSSWNW